MAAPNFLELLYGPHLKGVLSTDASSSASQFAGRTTLASGSTTVTISTAMVNSDSIILLGSEFPSTVTSGKAIHVGSINPGNHFIIAKDNGLAPDEDMTIMWLLLPTSDIR